MAPRASAPKSGKGLIGLPDAAAPGRDSAPVPDLDPLLEIPEIWRRSKDRNEALERSQVVIIKALTELAVSAGLDPQIVNPGSVWHLGYGSVVFGHDYDSLVKSGRSDEQVAASLRRSLNRAIDRLTEGTDFIDSLRKRAKIPFSLINKLTRAFKEELERRGVRSDIASDRALVIADDFVHSHADIDLRTIDPRLAAAILGSTYSATYELLSADIDKAAKAKSPDLWVDRDRQEFPTAESFLRHHYGHRLGIEGDLTLADVGRYDTPLHTALNREFSGRRHELHLLLPTVKQRADKRLLEKYGYVPQGKDRTSKLAVMSLERKLVP